MLCLVAGVWKDVFQRPVKRSQISTTPFELLVIIIPSLVCKLTDIIGTVANVMDFGLVGVGLAGKPPIFQNLTDLVS